jgi:hypothetical protein
MKAAKRTLENAANNFEEVYDTEDMVEVMDFGITLTTGVEMPDEMIEASVSAYEDGTFSARDLAEDLVGQAQREANRQADAQFEDTNPEPEKQ